MTSQTKQSTVAIIGLGYVGLPLALLTERKGWTVIGLDTDSRKLKMLQRGENPLHEAQFAQPIKASKIKFSNDLSLVSAADVIIICVPTPVKPDYQPDLRPLISACRSLGPYLKKGHLVIVESTVNPGVCEDVVRPLLEKTSKLTAGRDFDLAHCPERINPGDTKWTVENLPRVIGSLSATGLKKATAFYGSIISGQIKSMASLKEAEAVKMVENAFRDINIAFVNELAMSFHKLGINVKSVIDGAATKPFSFMAHYPGCGVGGHCIPVDPYYLINYAKDSGFSHDFLILARRINDQMPDFTVELLREGLAEAGLDLKSARVAVLGLAFKPNVADDRESPAYEIIKILASLGAKVQSYDPYIDRSTAKDLSAALDGANAVILATAHREFTRLTPAQLKAAGVKVVIDGRNAFGPATFKQAGLVYRGIGVD